MSRSSQRHSARRAQFDDWCGANGGTVIVAVAAAFAAFIAFVMRLLV